MNHDDRPGVEEIFHAALERTSPKERDAFLDGACGGDTELRARAEALLVAHEEAAGFLDQPVVDAESVKAQEGPGTSIGPYKLLQEIGEGGMGVVYMAEQEEPVRRKVALKIIKLGMDTKQVIARFEAERQALALMDHPNIAHVLDAGSTAHGRPYFVMELVRGVPIHEYCDTNQLPAEARLQLFIDTCLAVQHAHQKGIIHRDIKPGNVLVTSHDGKPVVKIIDFGVAKATNQKLTEKTLFTEFRQFIGTPEYMSPEQAEMSGLDVDTRTDIYALGVLLYQLLTGSTPFDPQTLRDAGFGEMTRIIREEQPAAPSTKVSKLGAALDELARRQGTEPSALVKLFRGDLDWIVMRAIEKDRTRRYDTASSLAEDVRRHLDNQPVNAGPPSTLYKLKKFTVRNRRPVAAGALATAGLLCGLALALVGFMRAREEADRSQRISDTLTELFALAGGSASPALDQEVESLLATSKEVFGEDHATVGATLNAMAGQLRSAGDGEGAAKLYREAIEAWSGSLGSDHPSVGTTLGALGAVQRVLGAHEEAEHSLRESLRILRQLPGRQPVSSCEPRRELAEMLMHQGQYEEAETLLREMLAIYRTSDKKQSFEIFATLEQLLHVGISNPETQDLNSVFAELAEAAPEVFPEGHTVLALTQFGWGNHLVQTGRLEEAEVHLREAVELFRATDDAPVIYLVMALDMTFQLVREATEPDEVRYADDLLVDFVAAARKLWTIDDRRLGKNIGATAERLAEHGRGPEALPLAREFLGYLQRNEPREEYLRNVNGATRLASRVILAPDADETDLAEALQLLAEFGPDADEQARVELNTIAARYRLGHVEDAAAALEAVDLAETGDGISKLMDEVRNLVDSKTPTSDE